MRWRSAADTVEVFTFGTRLTRITRALRLRDRDQALTAASLVVADWDGGTRLGDALAAFLAVPRFAALARGAAVIVRLRRPGARRPGRAARRGRDVLTVSPGASVWLTPLAADPGFEPQTDALVAIRRCSTTGRRRLDRAHRAPIFSIWRMRKPHDPDRRRPSSHLAPRRSAVARSGRCSRASSAPTSRSAATIRSANISPTSPAAASSNPSTCRPTGPRTASRTRSPTSSAPPRRPAIRTRIVGYADFLASRMCARSSTA